MERTFKLIIDDDSLLSKKAIDQKIIDSLDSTLLEYAWDIISCKEVKDDA